MYLVFIAFIVLIMLSIFLNSRCPKCNLFSLFLKDAKNQRDLVGVKKYLYRYVKCSQCDYEFKVRRNNTI